MDKGNGLLEVRFWDLSATTLFQRFPQVCRIRGMTDQGDQHCFSVLEDLPCLSEIDLYSDSQSEKQVERLLQGQHNLSAVHVEVRKTKFVEFLLHSISDFSGGRWIPGLMVSLIFRGPQQISFSLQISELLQILGVCPNLEVLDAETVFFDGSDSPLLDPCLPWVSKKLRKLRLGFWLNGHPNNLFDFHYLSEWSPILPETTARALKAAKNIAPSFMEQLGYQTDLRQLELSFNAAYRCGSSPFLQLAVGPANGLDQLSELHRLEDFSVTGLVHEVESTEIEWMVHNWPRLMKLQLPILDTKDNTTLVS